MKYAMIGVLLMGIGVGIWYWREPLAPAGFVVSQESALPYANQKTERAIEIKSNAPQNSQEVVPTETSSESVSVKKEVVEYPPVAGVVRRLVDFGFAPPAHPRTIDTIILHSSYDAIGNDPYSLAGVLAEWQDAGVSPHYVIDRKGAVYHLVEDANVAYHAGVSQMPDGRHNVNDFSIGIEMLNTKTDEYTNAEYTAVKNLIADLKSRYNIKYVLGHQDIAHNRKSDPWNFNWKKL
jgi:hypothetical protein